MEQDTVQAQRFLYLEKVQKSKGDPRRWDYSIAIGDELNFPRMLTEQITEYLWDKDLVKLQTYKQRFTKIDSPLSNLYVWE